MTCFYLPRIFNTPPAIYPETNQPSNHVSPNKVPLISQFSHRNKSDSQQDLKITQILVKTIISLLGIEHTANYQNNNSRIERCILSQKVLLSVYTCSFTDSFSKMNQFTLALKLGKTDSMVLLAMKLHGSPTDLLHDFLHFTLAILCIIYQSA